MKSVTYLIYCIFMGVFFVGGAAYAVIEFGRADWWVLVGAFICCLGYSPMKWIHGIDKDNL